MVNDRLLLADKSVVAVARSTEVASLDIIRAVDGTVDALTRIDEMLRKLARHVHDAVTDEVGKDAVVGKYVDPEDKAIEAFEQVEAGMKDFLHGLVSKRAAIDRDCQLQDHHCDALHEAYDQVMTTTAELIDVIRDMRHAIIAHDLAAEPRDAETFDCVADLSDSLRDA